jgi:tRNA G18 (ribose-2'-O)-methylase SpoU
MKQLSTDQLNRPDVDQYKTHQKMPVILVLDNIRSGLNVGAIFRTADAFFIEAIYLCGITAQPPHTEILKTALGATESVQWAYFSECGLALDQLTDKGYQLIPVEQTDRSEMLDTIALPDHFPAAFIFGNEMRGISPEILARCQWSVEIPQHGIKHSLNVATAAGILLWECYRQYLLRRFSSAV